MGTAMAKRVRLYRRIVGLQWLPASIQRGGCRERAGGAGKATHASWAGPRTRARGAWCCY